MNVLWIRAPLYTASTLRRFAVILVNSIVFYRPIIEFFAFNKKLPEKKFTTAKRIYLQWGLAWWLRDQESNTYSSELTWHVLVGGSLNWLFFMHHFTFQTGINRAWLCKDRKVQDLQANLRLLCIKRKKKPRMFEHKLMDFWHFLAGWGGGDTCYSLSSRKYF